MMQRVMHQQPWSSTVVSHLFSLSCQSLPTKLQESSWNRPTTNAAHQTTLQLRSSVDQICSNMQCVVHWRRTSGVPETCHRLTMAEKSTVDPDDLNCYQPISNLTFLSETIERVVATRFNEHADAHDLLPLHHAHHSTEMARRTQSSGAKRWLRWSHQCSGPIRSEQCLRHCQLHDPTRCAGKNVWHTWNGPQMVRLVPHWPNADLASGISEIKNVCRLLQCVTRLHRRSTEVRGLYWGSTSSGRTIRHRVSSLRWWYSALGRSTNHIRRSFNLEYGALYRCCTCLVLTEFNEVQDHLVWDPCQSDTFTAHRPQSTCWHSRHQAYQCRTWPRCAAWQQTCDATTSR